MIKDHLHKVILLQLKVKTLLVVMVKDHLLLILLNSLKMTIIVGWLPTVTKMTVLTVMMEQHKSIVTPVLWPILVLIGILITVMSPVTTVIKEKCQLI